MLKIILIAWGLIILSFCLLVFIHWINQTYGSVREGRFWLWRKFREWWSDRGDTIGEIVIVVVGMGAVVLCLVISSK